MNRIKLCKRYVAQRIAAADELLKEAKSKMKKLDFVELVMQQPVDVINPEVLEECAEAIEKRFPHEKRTPLFAKSERFVYKYTQTVKLWLADVCGVYETGDILTYFSLCTGFPVVRISRSTIDSPLIDRPYLISLIEKLEEATGKKLLNNDSNRPLTYLGDVSYEELAKYFSIGSFLIDARRLATCPDKQYLYTRYRREALKRYRELAEVDSKLTDEDMLKMPVGSFFYKTPKNWELPIFWLEAAFKVCLPEHIGKDLPVEKLLQMVAAAKVGERNVRR